ncbi:hypothetical protein C7S14_7737 [Burkholderia cepacia]|nr:hypothetical protein C7S14_7737 [Burkholderia cepacia]
MKRACASTARGERARCTTIRSPFDCGPARTETKRERIPSPVGRHGGQVERMQGKE